mmetsp:Transcript_92255/g.240794  ORF Transcript_92255/g.240794 Transcript_92255/m.240794 type:complete len:325 (+) Transcript_92255:79-1053(+)|eukprot:CAMPEP_0183401758 /NCGR_PEP_ID=MMETSP0370-20130417/13458_1 /TAXON_ID=268820 /ORGANISM="Peridinium aciculiferum, Strain PAER-2" /LENGTH=324 /DNA_ID=CAMNT_0025583245 /DNA_START=69 /DNA_END=1043 /DNA_ORIENTATION=+
MACVELDHEIRDESDDVGGLRKRRGKGMQKAKDAALIEDEVVEAKVAALTQDEVLDSAKSPCAVQDEDLETDSVSDDQQSPPTAVQQDHQQSSPTAAVFAAKLHVREVCPVGICIDHFAGVSPRVGIVSSKPCAAREYNEGVAPERRVLPGDFIISIRGRSTADMSAETLVSALREKRKLELAIARPFEFLVPSLDIRGGPLGMTLLYKNRGTCIQVKGLSDMGAVATHNALATPERQVKVGDWILAVNEATGSGERLKAALQHSSKVSLLLSRPSCEKVLDVQQGGCHWTTWALGLVALILAVIMVFYMGEVYSSGARMIFAD